MGARMGDSWLDRNGKISPRDLLFLAGFGVGVVVYVVTNSNKSDQTAKDLDAFQTTVTGTIAEIRGEVRAGITNIRTDIASLPDQRARLLAVERRLSEGDARDVAQDARLSAVERSAIETAAQVTNLRAASSQNLPNAPGIRR